MSNMRSMSSPCASSLGPRSDKRVQLLRGGLSRRLYSSGPRMNPATTRLKWLYIDPDEVHRLRRLRRGLPGGRLLR